MASRQTEARLGHIEKGIEAIDEQLDSKARAKELRLRQLAIMKQQLADMDKKIATAETSKEVSAHKMEAMEGHMDNITQASDRKAEVAAKIQADLDKSNKLVEEAKAHMAKLQGELKHS